MVCNDCSHSLTYLYKAGVVNEDLFLRIIAGHKNNRIFKLIESIKLNDTVIGATFRIPSILLVSLVS